ncbi:MAG: hypothetical protein NT025_04315 [bacterium]|nr:hypothetical protein [bacterium]
MNRTVRELWVMAGALLGILAPVHSHAQVVRPHMGYQVAITDQTFIGEFINQQSLSITGAVDSLVFIDADGQGFGENDLVTAYPSKQTFPLMQVEEPSRSYMAQWQFAHPNQFTSPRKSSSELFRTARDPDDPDALKGMLAFIVRGLELYYKGVDVKGQFRQDSATVFIEVWDFDPNLFRYRDSEGIGMADTFQAYDLLHVLRNDTLLLSDSTLYDVIYVYKTFSDTVFVPQVRPAEGNGAGH